MSSNEPGFAVTTSRLSFVLGLVALLGVAWRTIGFAKDHEFRLTALEAERIEQRQLNKELIAEIKQLSNNITALTIIMRGKLDERP